MKKVTIKDVAREAGVSITTVSHALNGGGVLKDETRKRVFDIAANMGYIPDWNGSNLKAKETFIIGLFVSSMEGSYYGVLADTLYKHCHEKGYELDVFITDVPQLVMKNILSNRIDGAVILHIAVGEEDVEKIRKLELPVVFLDREEEGECISSVVFNSYMTGRKAGEYLLGLGYKKIGYVAGVPGVYDSEERFRGFSDVMKENRLEIKKENILTGMFERKRAFDEMIKFIDSGAELPEAIFAANDLSAIGCIEALKSRGIQVPEQVSVIGCDDIELCEWYNPKITTIHTNFAMQGQIAAERILTMIQQKQKGCIQKIEGRIVERESCTKKTS